jgi:hypothetical protein
MLNRDTYKLELFSALDNLGWRSARGVWIDGNLALFNLALGRTLLCIILLDFMML